MYLQQMAILKNTLIFTTNGQKFNTFLFTTNCWNTLIFTTNCKNTLNIYNNWLFTLQEPLQGKRPHVKTEKMMEFIKTQEEQHKHFSCPFEGCTKVLTSYPGLKYHIQRNHEPQSDGFICEKCLRSFKR